MTLLLAYNPCTTTRLGLGLYSSRSSLVDWLQTQGMQSERWTMVEDRVTLGP